MAIKQLKLPLFNETYYTYSVSLEGNKYVLDFLFLERLQQWVVTLKNSNGDTLVRNQRLTPEAELFLDYKLPNLTGAFYLKIISPDEFQEDTGNLENPKGFYELYYIYNDGE